MCPEPDTATPTSPHRGTRALTLVEVLVVAAVLALLALLCTRGWYPLGPNRSGIICLNNLKQIGLSASTWAMDNGNQFPRQVPAAKGGSLQAALGNPVPHFCAMSNALSTPMLLACKADDREYATDFSTLKRENLSHFLGMDALPSLRRAILAGDRNLAVGGRDLQPGLFALTTNETVAWTRRLHTRIKKLACGYLLLDDGHAELVSTNTRVLVAGQGLATNHLAVP